MTIPAYETELSLKIQVIETVFFSYFIQRPSGESYKMSNKEILKNGNCRHKSVGRKFYKKAIYICCACLAVMCMLTGCKKAASGPQKLRDLELTVVAKENLPPELLQIIEEKKEQPFKFTFQDGENLYICVGYGMQESGGYSITVEDLFLAENAIYAKTCLIGPGPDVVQDGVCSYPYIVMKTEYLDYSVVFD